MRILFLGKRYYTRKDLLKDRFGRLFHLPRVLVKCGHQVEVVALDYWTHEFSEKREGNLLLRSEPSRTGGLFIPKGKLLVPGGETPDLIIGTGHLHIAAHALRLAHGLGTPFVFEAYDYYPAFLPKAFSFFSAKWFRYLCRQANGCIAVSHELGRLMSQANPETLVVENGFEPAVFKKISRSSGVAAFKLDPGKRFVCFIGSATESLGFGDFLKAVNMVRRTIPEVLGIHAGFMDQRFRQTKECTSLGPIQQTAVSTLLSSCDCGVVPYRETPQVRYSNSCKLVEYLAVGLPVVATRTGDNVRILGENHPGLIPAANPGVLAEAILKQLQHPYIAPYPLDWTWDRLGSKLNHFLEKISDPNTYANRFN